MNHKDIKNQMARGVMAPLFDRLCDNNPDILDENPQVYILSLEQLQKSIYQELERILNTRPTFTAASQESRAVLDDKRKIDEPLLPTAYGLADFSWFDSAKPWTIAHLAQQIVNVIHRYEPRLAHVKVNIIGKVMASQGLKITIDGDVHYNAGHERLHFPLTLKER